ncbi:unnamed protein product [Chondrus crispus]|uniref:Uncharacterized protein n=1 Tax=Chondrus crispus TaxID=2769 RepID=R7QMB4_CHOCR|nr:unnamed protein product [Chondrus crispus]CDF38913.1 unnamed protein product [Chondrus crispus]|eukprot:XP_005718818.1 unnamed protein product [Chondrus crispus]
MTWIWTRRLPGGSSIIPILRRNGDGGT